MLKASHTFNLLDARQRDLGHRTPALHLARAHAGARRRGGLLREPRGARASRCVKSGTLAAGRVMARPRFAVRVRHRRTAAQAATELVRSPSNEGLLKGLATAGVRAWQAARLRDAAPAGRAASRHAPSSLRIGNCERRGPPVSNSFDAAGAPTQAAHRLRQELRRPGRGARAHRPTDKGAWLAFRGTEPGAATVSLLARHRQRKRSPRCRSPSACAGAPDGGVRAAGALAWCCCTAMRSCRHECSGSSRAASPRGHRFMRQRPISLKSPQAYEAQLRQARQSDRGLREAARARAGRRHRRGGRRRRHAP